MPPKFSGSDNTDINMWLQMFEDFAADSEWNDAKMASKIKLLLSGEALVFVWDLPEDKKKSFASIKEELEKFYSSKENSFCAMSEFESRKRRQGESLRELCLALKLLYRKARPEHAQTVRDCEVRHRLLALLPREIREALLKDPDWDKVNPEQLADRATALESIGGKGAPASVAVTSVSTLVTDRLEQMQEQLADLAATVATISSRGGQRGRGRGARGKGSSRGRCFNCAQPGHFAAQCPRRQAASAMPPMCSRCSGKGHRAEVCPTPASENF